MAIEIEPKTRREKGPLVKYSLYIGVALLLIMAAGYAFLYFSVNRAEGKLADLEEQVKQQMSEEDKQLRQDILQTQQKLERSSQIIDSHHSVYNFLTSLESMTHPHVKFTRMQLYTDQNRLELDGITEGFVSLGQQAKNLQETSLIKNAEIRDTSMKSGGKVSFNLLLTLSSKVFKFPPEESE